MKVFSCCDCSVALKFPVQYVLWVLTVDCFMCYAML